ncbi:MAG: HNH endonuclease family protein [Crocosphaera sp.]
MKADLIGKVSDNKSLEDKYTKKWEDIEVKLGRDNFQELFSHIRMIYAKKRLSRKVIEEFREYVLTNFQDDACSFIDKVLEPFSDAFYDIKNCDFIHNQYAHEINELLKWLQRIDHSEWIPPTIFYVTKHRNQPEKIFKFLTKLERLAVGLMILRTNIYQRNKRYAAILQAIEDDADLYGPESSLQLSASEQQEIMKLLNGNLYEMRKINRYILLRLDSLISDGVPNYDGYRVITIEHILPQNPQENSQWTQQWFPSQEERNKYVHRLGNLVLLSRKKNSEAQNYEYKVKKDTYINNPTAIFALTIQAIQEQEWTPEIIERRQQDLLSKLQHLWNLNLSN